MQRVVLLVHRARSKPPTRQPARGRGAVRPLDELRAARPHGAGAWSSGTPTVGLTHSAVSHALRSI